jgi:hypothetical protein
MVTYLIATAMKPKKDTFIPNLLSIARLEGVEITAVLMVEGPGCANIAFRLEEPNEKFAEGLCMALQPAKWSTTGEVLEPGTFTDLLER